MSASGGVHDRFSAGPVGHVDEEQDKSAMRAIWETAEHTVAYDGTSPS